MVKKKKNDYTNELDELNVKHLIGTDANKNPYLEFKFENVEVHPYIRHRVAHGKSMYDPLNKYKTLFVNTICEYLTTHPDIEEYITDLKDHPLAVSIHVDKLPPKSFSLSKLYYILSEDTPDYVPMTKPDNDNYAKTLNDIINMTERVWDDDAQIGDLTITKSYSLAPSTTFRVTYLPAQPKTFTRLNKEDMDTDLFKQIRKWKNMSN